MSYLLEWIESGVKVIHLQRDSQTVFSSEDVFQESSTHKVKYNLDVLGINGNGQVGPHITAL